MKQVIVIGGGTTFLSYNDFTHYLSSKSLNIDRFVYKPTWKERLQETLGSKYQVLLPAMPNKTNAKYSEWSIWFNHISSLFTEDIILIGHSLGAVFLVKYLSENTLNTKINKLILVATPFDDETLEDLTDFKITKISNKLTSQATDITFFQGIDDPVISMSDFDKYQKALPNAKFILLSAPDHFSGRSDFPEIIEAIKN